MTNAPNLVRGTTPQLKDRRNSAAEAAFLRGADLTGSQRAKISHTEAERLFRIPAPAAIGWKV